MNLKEKIQNIFSNKVWGGLIVLSALTLAYHWYLNRFAPITEGWFSTYCTAMMHGKVPYRDFYFFITPFYLYLYLGIMTIFGGTFLVQRLYGAAERVGLNGILYITLTKYFKPAVALFACVVGFCLYANHSTDLIYSYYQTALLFAVICVFALSRYDNKKSFWPLVFTGVFSAMCFLTKQSMGLFIFTLIFCYLFIILFHRPKKMFDAFAAVIIPAAAVLIIMALYLNSKGALDDCISQIFTDGIQSKGSMAEIITGFYATTFTIKKIAVFALAFAGWISLRKGLIPIKERKFNKKEMTIIIILIFLFSLLICNINLFSFKSFVVNSVFYSSCLLGGYYAFWGFKRELKPRESFYLLMSGASFAIMYSHGLSAMLEDHSSLIGFSFFIALLIETKTHFNKIKNIFVIIFFSVFTCFLIFNRYSAPYDWWSDKEDAVWTADSKVDIPAYKGLKMSDSSAQKYQELISLIHQNIKTPEDKIYISQNIAGLYYASGTQPFTFAYADYFDVCNDACALRNAKDIKTTMPKMIIYLDFPEYIWILHERIFRQSRPSKQREIRQTIKDISKNYNLIKVYNETKSYLDDYRLYVWVRK